MKKIVIASDHGAVALKSRNYIFFKIKKLRSKRHGCK